MRYVLYLSANPFHTDFSIPCSLASSLFAGEGFQTNLLADLFHGAGHPLGPICKVSTKIRASYPQEVCACKQRQDRRGSMQHHVHAFGPVLAASLGPSRCCGHPAGRTKDVGVYNTNNSTSQRSAHLTPPSGAVLPTRDTSPWGSPWGYRQSACRARPSSRKSCRSLANSTAR